MAGGNPDGFKPAPWETGKPNTQGPFQQPVPPRPPAPPPGIGPAPAQFGGGDTGRGRTRPIPHPQPPAYGAPQQAVPQQGYAAPPQPAGYGAPQNYAPQPQAAGYGPPQGYGAPPQPQPYGQQGYGDAAYPMKKPTTVFGIVSLCLMGVGLLAGLASFGLFSIPFFLVGGILGYVGIRETAAWGKKSGRGLAMGGTISNGALFVLNVAGWAAIFLIGSAAVDDMEQQFNAQSDGDVIVRALGQYHQAKGDLLPGGPQIRLGVPTQTAVTGAQLSVSDLVSPTELQNPVDKYALTVSDGRATVWYNDESGNRVKVGAYPQFGGSFGGLDDSEEWGLHPAPQPPPRQPVFR
jgi:hypothetical protein